MSYTIMIKALLLFIILNTGACIGQEIECQYAPSNDYTGMCESFYTNGNIRSQTEFLNGMRNGNHTEYYGDGRLAASATYYKELYIGKIYRYSQDSIVIFFIELDSTETGKFIYYDKDGKTTLATGQFKNAY